MGRMYEKEKFESRDLQWAAAGNCHVLCVNHSIDKDFYEPVAYVRKAENPYTGVEAWEGKSLDITLIGAGHARKFEEVHEAQRHMEALVLQALNDG